MTIMGSLLDHAASVAGHAANYASGAGNMLLVDFETYRPPEELRARLKDVMIGWNGRCNGDGITYFYGLPVRDDGSLVSGKWGTLPEPEDPSDPQAVQLQDNRMFQLKIWSKSGLSANSTFLPKSIHPKYCGANPQTDLDSAMSECKMAVCGAMEGLLQKLNLQAKDIDILVTTCSIYCPTPSMAAMVINHFKMRKDTQAYHLGGMGCANGVVACNMMHDLLKAHPNSNAVLICNETTAPAFYGGKDKHRLVTNVIFRMGASAILFSNKKQWLSQGQAKYRLQKAVRVHIGARDEAYRAIHYGPDEEGINGIYLGHNVVQEATRALTKAMHQIGPYVLTTRQLLQAVWHYTAKYLGVGKQATFEPCFAEGMEHFLIHAGGAKVLDGIASSLKLQPSFMEPSRAVLSDYGNVSSSSTWYAMSFIETVQGVRRGERMLQVGVGSGIKCGVNIWEALRDIDDCHSSWSHREVNRRRASGRHNSIMYLLFCLLFACIVVALAVVVHGYDFRFEL